MDSHHAIVERRLSALEASAWPDSTKTRPGRQSGFSSGPASVSGFLSENEDEDENENDDPASRSISALQIRSDLRALQALCSSNNIDDNRFDARIANLEHSLNEIIKHSFSQIASQLEKPKSNVATQSQNSATPFDFSSAPWVAFADSIASREKRHNSPSEQNNPLHSPKAKLLRKRKISSQDENIAAHEDDERFLSEQQKLQDAYSDELLRMADRLKTNSLMFGDSLKKDKEVCVI
ncbi:hypothetical protein HK100_006752 [Physocladia obscura]|uniref:Uncharacterized protein n=1 Tax=Physocladia obscura TaxID=109957 RepID=A0AAD5SQ77_9FUNG|nr:hypothetical protein HK100_006752 [Physocladia obscura]